MRTYNLSGASQLVPLPASPFIYYRGFQVRETAGVQAVIRIFDSRTGATGTVLDEISLGGYESARETYGSARIARSGIYVQVVSGTFVGSINFD